MIHYQQYLALIFDVGGEYDRRLICAIASANASLLQAPLRVIARWKERETLDTLRASPPLGIIFAPFNEGRVAEVRELGAPLVDIAQAVPNSDLSTVVSDNPRIGEMAARHLASQGLQRFAYIGRFNLAFSADRLGGFRQGLARHGINTDENLEKINLRQKMLKTTVEPQLPPQEQIVAFLKSTATPIGILTEEDRVGNEVVRAALSLGMDVPSDVSVVGVDDDPVACQLVTPWLSSVRQDTDKIGSRTIQEIKRQLDGDTRPRVYKVPPMELIARGSSDFLRSGDPEVAKAVLYIREHAGAQLTVDDVVAWTSVSRRTLEYRFRKELGRTILDEVRNIRLDRAIMMLVESDLSVGQIAVACGFTSAQRFATVFREMAKLTPSEYRKVYASPREEEK